MLAEENFCLSFRAGGHIHETVSRFTAIDLDRVFVECVLWGFQLHSLDGGVEFDETVHPIGIQSPTTSDLQLDLGMLFGHGWNGG